MATLSIFAIRLGRLLLVCERDTALGHVLIVQGARSVLSLDAASALGEAAWRIRLRARKAVDGRMTPGPIFSIELPETKVTIGVTEDGADLYVETGGEHVRLSEEELEGLMFALRRLNADATSVLRAMAAAARLIETNMVPKLRGFSITHGGETW
jgi:hypothetical protein